MATEEPISAFPALGGAPASGDLIPMVDVSDTADASTGTNKKMTTANLFTSPTFTGTVNAAALNLSGDFAIATSLFTVAAASGNTVIVGTLAVGAATTVAFASATVTLNATTGNPALTFQRAGVQTALVASGAADEIDFLNHLGASMGNVIAGAWSLPGNLAINTNKFTVAASTGNTLVAGTLGVTGAITGPNVAVTAGLTSSGPTGAGIGYATGAGTTVTQSSSYTNGVTINTLCGEIITAGGTITPQTSASFTVTNSTVAIGDVVLVAIRSGSLSDGTIVAVKTVAAGSFAIRIFNASTSTNETAGFGINFAVLKAVTA